MELEKKVDDFEGYTKVQLSKCAEMIEEVLKKCKIEVDDSKIYFVLVCKYWKDRLLRPSKDLHRLVIRFRGKDRNVIIKCGGGKAYLSEIIESFQ